jgi:hypothetical protein
MSKVNVFTFHETGISGGLEKAGCGTQGNKPLLVAHIFPLKILIPIGTRGAIIPLIEAINSY